MQVTVSLIEFLRRCAIALELSFLSTQKRDHTQHDEVFYGIEHDQLNRPRRTSEEVVKTKNASNATMKTYPGLGKHKNDLLDVLCFGVQIYTYCTNKLKCNISLHFF